MSFGHRSRTAYSNQRPPSVLPTHTRCQEKVDYTVAKRVQPRGQQLRRRTRRLVQSSTHYFYGTQSAVGMLHLRKLSKDKVKKNDLDPSFGRGSSASSLPTASPRRYMTVFVKTPVGELLQLPLGKDASAALLYSEVERRTGLPASDYKILYQGKWPICPLLSLPDQAVDEKSTLELCLTLKGGADRLQAEEDGMEVTDDADTNDDDTDDDDTEDDDEDTDVTTNKLRDFHQLMIGASGNVVLTDPFLCVETKTLTPAILLDCFRKAKTDNTGLTFYLVTFMIDLLKRRRSLRALTSYEVLDQSAGDGITLGAIGQEFEELADYCEFKHKELLISLLEALPEELHCRLMTFCAQSGHPCPFLYRRVSSQGHVEVVLRPEAYEDVLCIPNNPIVLSCGTSTCIGKGKSLLLSRMFGLPVTEEDFALELHPGGPCHHLSIDFVFEGVLTSDLTTFTVADAHGYCSDNNEFKIGLNALASGAVLTLVHVTSDNFSNKGEPDDEVGELLQLCSNVMEGRKCLLIVLWRDFAKSQEKKLKCTRKNLRRFCPTLSRPQITICFCEVPNMMKLNELRRGTAVTQIVKEAVDILIREYDEKKQNFPKMPNARDLVTSCATNPAIRVVDGAVARTDSSRLRKVTLTELNKIGREMNRIMNAAEQNCRLQKLSECFFPASTIDSRIADLEEKGNRIVRNEGFSAKEIENIDLQLRTAKLKKKSCDVSVLVSYFAKTVATNGIAAVHEFDRQLNMWKGPRCDPLIDARTRLYHALEERLLILKNEKKKSETDTDYQKFQSQIRANLQKLDKYDISIDDVWSEVMSLSGNEEAEDTTSPLEEQCQVSPRVLQSVYRRCVLSGHPIQLLRGRPLYMMTDFLSNVLRTIQHNDKKKLFIVSVIGIQSSAKSTLLNYLFGCHFVTRAGRCTRGLYASYMTSRDVDVIVLDSEGLMSVEDGSKEFDNEITLMAMACSHVVIINQKGELQRQLGDLLEVALFALKHLEVLKLQPDIVFVLRDQADLDSKAQKSQLIKMGQALTEHAASLNVQMSEYIDLSPEALHLLPPAFHVEERKGKSLKKPVTLFSAKVLKLREKLFTKHIRRLDEGQVPSEFMSMPNWLSHARNVWRSIRKYGGNLVYYESMREIEQRVEISAIFEMIVDNKLQSEDGFNAKCESLLNISVGSKQEVVVAGLASTNLKRDVEDAETVARAEVLHIFDEMLKGQTYPTDLRREFRQKLCGRISEKKQAVLDAWRGYEETVKATTEYEEIETSMASQMNAWFMSTGTTQSVHEVRCRFEVLWEKKVGEVEKKRKEGMTTDRQLACRINSLFVDQITTNQTKKVFACLQPGVPGIPDSRDVLLTRSRDSGKLDIWNEYLHINRGYFGMLFTSKRSEQTARRACALRLKNAINVYFSSKNMSCYFGDEWKLDQDFMNILMSKTVEIIQEQKSQCKESSDGLLCIKESEFANAVCDCLRRRIFDEYKKKIDREHKERKKELEKLKCKNEDRILTRLMGIEDDQWRAAKLVDALIAGIKDWLNGRVAAFILKVEPKLLTKFENAEAAAKFAFQESFESQDWAAVVQYCDNASGYLQSVYDRRFHNESKQDKHHEVDRLKTGINNAIESFNSEIDRWKDEMTSKEKAKSQQKTSETTTQSLIDYCGSSSASRLASDAMLDLVKFVPVFKVAHPSTFARAYQMKRNEQDDYLYKAAEDEVAKKLNEAKRKIWQTASGCPAVCPLCSAKCTLPGGHRSYQRKHECAIHLYPAFGGTSSYEKNEPTFGLCTSKDIIEVKKWTRKSDPTTTWRSLKDHFEHYYPDWKVPTVSPDLDTARHHVHLRRAWVNTRNHFIRRHEMVDSTPAQWIEDYTQ